MIEQLEKITRKISERELTVREVAIKIRKEREDFFVEVEGTRFTGKIGAVDGGLLAEYYHGFEVLATRAVGVVFNYENGELTDVEYFPSALPDPEIVVRDVPVDEEDEIPSKSLVRLRKEVETAIELAEKFSPDLLFMDGSITPLLADRPRGKALKGEYNHVVKLFRKLYFTGTDICGIVKDPKGNRVSTFLGIGNTRDVSLLFHAMNVGEMTRPISYAENPDQHPTLKDIGVETAKKMKVFYMKASDYDIPLRVEYIGPEEKGYSLASTLLPLCSLNRTFTIPPFLLEADIRARMGSKDMKYIKEYIEKRLGPKYAHIKYRRENKW